MIKLDKHLPLVDNFKAIVLDELPIVDVRAPIEFAKGHAPNAVNLPLIDDEERDRIGKTYKKCGQDEAVALGLKLVADEKKTLRIAAWRDYIEKNPTAILSCFRGGMRSAIAQQWLYETANVKVPRIAGGYKAMRQFLLDQLTEAAFDMPLILVAGHTGAGKTKVIKALNNAIDLEGLAVHRGSSFGNYATPQPTQVNFENQLAKALLQLKQSGQSALVIEKEGRNIGRNRLPEGLYNKMASAQIVVVESTLDERIENTWQDYVIDDLEKYAAVYGDAGRDAWAEHLRDSMLRLKKRLGAERMSIALKHLDDALATDDLAAHKAWIGYLLENYYDPMYSYQRDNWQQKIVFSGRRDKVIEYLKKS